MMQQREYERPSIESSETVEAHLGDWFPDLDRPRRPRPGPGNVGS